ncbi:MAG TPA: hypothetical protein VFA40_00390 [Terriglobales bacterium]|jgi:hypothetical protein|nr:hypothetical protein [Terriglobales bacterium]
MGKVFDALFGCWHPRYSFPITVKAGLRRNKAAALTGTYVVCLDCGKEFGYDWQEMRVVSGTLSPTSAVRSFATKEAA